LPSTALPLEKLSTEILALGKSLHIEAIGASMSPLIRSSDTLVIQPANANSLKCGDVILFIGKKENMVIHRLIRIKRTSQGRLFLAQGDQAAASDGWVTPAQVFGRVTSIERGEVHLNMDQPELRFLNRLAALRSRWPILRGAFFHGIQRLLQHTPGFSRYFN